MIKLKRQVNEGMDSISMFRNIHENDRRYIHIHCLAIHFYLNHYQEEEGRKGGWTSWEVEAKEEEEEEHSRTSATDQEATGQQEEVEKRMDERCQVMCAFY